MEKGEPEPGRPEPGKEKGENLRRSRMGDSALRASRAPGWVIPEGQEPGRSEREKEPGRLVEELRRSERPEQEKVGEPRLLAQLWETTRLDLERRAGVAKVATFLPATKGSAVAIEHPGVSLQPAITQYGGAVSSTGALPPPPANRPIAGS